MGLITFYEPNWERAVRSAYAESKSNAITQTAVQNIGILIQNNCYLYRIEETSNGSFIGFVVYEGTGVPTLNYNGDMIPRAGRIRPQFAVQPILAEYQYIISTTGNNNI